MVNGVVNGYEKKLEIVGVGLRCQKQGSNLVMNLGFSHQVNIPDTEDCTIVWQDPNHFTVTGIDKQKVGQYAAEIRAKKPPEPYKGCLLYTSRNCERYRHRWWCRHRRR